MSLRSHTHTHTLLWVGATVAKADADEKLGQRTSSAESRAQEGALPHETRVRHNLANPPPRWAIRDEESVVGTPEVAA